MKGIVCNQPNEFLWKDMQEPLVEQGEALVRIQRIGICGTDLHAYQGNQPYFKYPRVLGHELAGVIEAVEVSHDGLKKGDQVTILPYMECGKCATCLRGKPNCCTNMKVIGVHTDGGMRERIVVPIDHILKTEGLTLDQSALVEPLSIGAHAVRRSSISKDEKVLVIGAGPIGLGVMTFAKQKGAKVIAMDIDDDRLTFCKEWAKVEDTINAQDDPITRLSEMTNGDYPVAVFDATGNPQSMNQSFQYVAHGGKVIFVGLVKDDIRFSDPEFHSKELTLMGSRNATHEDFEYVMDYLRSGMDIEGYITHRCAFDQMINQFDDWLIPESKVIKSMVEL